MKIVTILTIAATTGILTVLAADPSLINTNELTRVGTTVRLPGLVIHDASPPYIEATGKISITKGLLEFIAVEPKGRDYESLFILDCKPSALQFSLLLIGCHTGTVQQIANFPIPIPTPGTSLSIEAQWKTTDGKVSRVPIEKWLLDRKTEKPPSNLLWHFNGSAVVKNPANGQPVFLSDAEHAHIALWEQPSILINLASPAGNPYQGDQQGFDINTDDIPPAGTAVTLIFRAAKP